MELSLEAILGVIVALVLSAIAIFRLRTTPEVQPDPLAPHESIDAPPAPAPVSPTAEVLGLFADANGEYIWNYLDPARHTLYVRLRGTRRGPLYVGLEVDGRVGDTTFLTIGEDSPIEKVQTFAMEFPRYDRYRSPGLHQVSVLTGYPPDQPGADPIWTDRVDYQVEVVQR